MYLSTAHLCPPLEQETASEFADTLTRVAAVTSDGNWLYVLRSEAAVSTDDSQSSHWFVA